MKKSLIIIILIVIAVIVSIFLNQFDTDSAANGTDLAVPDITNDSQQGGQGEVFGIDFGPLCSDLGGSFSQKGSDQTCSFSGSESESNTEFYCGLIKSSVDGGDIPGYVEQKSTTCTYKG